jgi:hypothetical protein
MPVPNAYPDIVLTDPLVRQTQIGPAPMGILTGVDLTRGVGMATVPGAGTRVVRTVGPVVETPAGPAVRAVDASTGVEFLALTPASASPIDPGPVVAAKVVSVTSDGVILERTENGKKITEILPSSRVYSAVRGGFVPAGSIRRLRAGAEVMIPTTGGPRGTITLTRTHVVAKRPTPASLATKSKKK